MNNDTPENGPGAEEPTGGSASSEKPDDPKKKPRRHILGLPAGYKFDPKAKPTLDDLAGIPVCFRDEEPPRCQSTQTGTHRAAGCGSTVASEASKRHPMSTDVRARIVCLCGSTAFMDAFDAANRDETLKGHIVLSVGVDLKKRHIEVLIGKSESEAAAIKERLDHLHRQKIDLADEILVLNVGGRVGDSTQGEIEYARKTGKLVRFLEPEQTTSS